jgi:hypothetical protein
MSKAFSNKIDTKSDNPIYNRMMTNYNENPSYTQFGTNQLNDSLQLLSATDNLTTQSASNKNISLFDQFVTDRESVLDFNMNGLPIQNPTTQPNQNNNQLDFSTQLPKIDHDIPSFAEFVIHREPV